MILIQIKFVFESLTPYLNQMKKIIINISLFLGILFSCVSPVFAKMPDFLVADNLLDVCRVDSKEEIGGCYLDFGNESNGKIIISSKLSGGTIEHIVFHEYGHYFLRNTDREEYKNIFGLKDSLETVEMEEIGANMFSYWMMGFAGIEEKFGDYFRNKMSQA